MNWTFIIAPERSSFITSDNPLTRLVTREFINLKKEFPLIGAGFIVPGVWKAIPLSQMCCLIMMDHGRSINYKEVSSADVRLINLNTANNCDQYLYGRDKALLRSLVSHTKIDKKQWRPEMRWSSGVG